MTLTNLGQDFDAIVDVEPDMGLGNGGLGRLAACFLDSLATMDLPAIGYGIHYRHGLFRQEFLNGHQVEEPDNWTEKGCPWEIMRPLFYKKVRSPWTSLTARWTDGKEKSVWLDYKTIDGVPYDIPIVGHGGKTGNFLRLWESVAGDKFDLEMFNQGSYVEAVREKAEQETISKVLYPMTVRSRQGVTSYSAIFLCHLFHYKILSVVISVCMILGILLMRVQ